MSDLFKIAFSIKRESKNIFLFPNNGDYIDCHNIHMQIYNEIQNNIDYQEYQNITKQDLLQYECFIFFESQLLTGGSESNKPHNACFFGELDKEGVFRESKPIYHLIGESNYDTKDSKESFTQTLQVFLGSNTLTLLNYSLLDSSLNIKLECNSKESKAILEKEKEQREQKEKESQTQDSSLTASNDNSQSTSMLHPILEDNEIKCPHNGVVRLKANKGKTFTSKGIPLASKDILFASK